MINKVKNEHDHKIYEKNINGIDIQLSVHGEIDMRNHKGMIYTIDMNLIPNVDVLKSYSGIMDLLNERNIEGYSKSASTKMGVEQKEVLTFLKEVKNDLVLLKSNYKGNIKEIRLSESSEQPINKDIHKYLSNKNLLKILLTDMKEVGVNGRNEDVLLIVLTIISRLTDTPIIMNGMQGFELVSKIGSIISGANLIQLDHISDKSVFYFQNNLIGKSIIVNKDNLTQRQIEDLIQLSKNGISKIQSFKNRSGEIVNSHIKSNGGCSIIFHSCKEKRNKNEYVINKHFEVDKEKGDEIELLKYTSPSKYNEIESKMEFISQVFDSLVSHKVITPGLQESFMVYSSTEQRQIISLIQSVVITHQFQREKEKVNGITYLIATIEDVQLAIELFDKIKNESKEVLSPAINAIWGSWSNKLNEKEIMEFSSRDFKIENDLSNRYSSQILNNLIDNNLIYLKKRVKGVENIYSIVPHAKLVPT